MSIIAYQDEENFQGQGSVPEWKRLLINRRISPQVIDLFQVQPEEFGWSYPVPNGGSYRRWKAFNSSSKYKYRWIPQKPGNAVFYHSSNFEKIIHKYQGVCWYVSGEADVWAMHSAGIFNVFSGYGEGSVPPEITDFLLALGINKVRIAPDLDSTGKMWAGKVSECLKGSGIQLEICQLPETLGVHGDIGLAWQKFDGKNGLFEDWLLILQRRDVKVIENLSVFPSKKGNIKIPEYKSGIPISYRLEIAWKLGVYEFKSNGVGKNNVSCPFHDDKNPSASLHIEKGLYCHACGETYLWQDLGIEIGVGSIKTFLKENELVLPQIHRPKSCVLSTETREAFSKLGVVLVPRLLDALNTFGWLPGSTFTVSEIVDLCSYVGIKKSSVYRALKPYTLHTSECLQFFPINTDIKRKGEENATKGRRAKRFVIPSPEEIANILSVENKFQHYDPMPVSGLYSNRAYRAEIHAALIRRRPGEYTRAFLAQRLGVSERTTRTYDVMVGITVKPQYRRRLLRNNEIHGLPIKKSEEFRAIWLEDEAGKKYPYTQEGARIAFSCSQRVAKVRRLPNHYEIKKS